MESNEKQIKTENQGKKEIVTRLGMDELRRVRGGFGITAATNFSTVPGRLKWSDVSLKRGLTSDL